MTDGEDPPTNPDDEVQVAKGEFTETRLSRLTAPPELEDDDNRERWGLGRTQEERGPYLRQQTWWWQRAAGLLPYANATTGASTFG